MPIEITLKNAEAQALLKALNGPSCGDKLLSDLYYRIEAALDEAKPTAPWRNVMTAKEALVGRGTLAAAWLVLDCGHKVREAKGDDFSSINRKLAKGVKMRRRCSECAGGSRRAWNP